MLSILDDNYYDKISKSNINPKKYTRDAQYADVISRLIIKSNQIYWVHQITKQCNGRPNILEWQEQHFSTLPSWLTEKLGKCMNLGSRIDTEEDFGANNLKH